MKNNTKSLPASIENRAMLAEFACLFGIILFIGFSIYVLILLFVGTGVIDTYLGAEFLKGAPAMPLTAVQRWIGIILSAIPGMLGVWILWYARDLFRSYRQGEIFTLDNADRLKKIGLGLVLLAPLSIVLSTLTEAILSAWLLHSLRVNIGLETVEIFSFIFGLLFTVIAQIMFEATRLDAENKSFV